MGIHVQVKYKATNLQLICWRNHWRFHYVFSVVFKKLQAKQEKNIKGAHTKDFNRSFKFVHGYYTLPVVEFQVQSGSLILWGNFLRKLGICRFSFYFSVAVQNACVFISVFTTKRKTAKVGEEKQWRKYRDFLLLTRATFSTNSQMCILLNIYVHVHTLFSKDQTKNNIYFLLATVSVVVAVVEGEPAKIDRQKLI